MNKEDKLLYERYNRDVIDEGLWDTAVTGVKDAGRKAYHAVRKNIPSPLGIGDVGRGSSQSEAWILDKKTDLAKRLNQKIPGNTVAPRDFVNWFSSVFEKFLKQDPKMDGYTKLKNPVLLGLMSGSNTPQEKSDYLQHIEDAVRQGKTYKATGRFTSDPATSTDSTPDGDTDPIPPTEPDLTPEPTDDDYGDQPEFDFGQSEMEPKPDPLQPKPKPKPTPPGTDDDQSEFNFDKQPDEVEVIPPDGSDPGLGGGKVVDVEDIGLPKLPYTPAAGSTTTGPAVPPGGMVDYKNPEPKITDVVPKSQRNKTDQEPFQPDLPGMTPDLPGMTIGGKEPEEYRDDKLKELKPQLAAATAGRKYISKTVADTAPASTVADRDQQWSQAATAAAEDLAGEVPGKEKQKGKNALRRFNKMQKDKPTESVINSPLPSFKVFIKGLEKNV